MKKILLSGDSWGYGAGYGPPNNNIAISTAEAFAEYDFTNVSVPASSNNDNIRKIHQELCNSKYDAIFWIQTDPMRDVWNKFGIQVDDGKKSIPLYLLSDYGIDLISTTNLVKHMEDLLSKTYSYLNHIAETSNKKIHCLGGCSMLHQSISQYPNLIPIIPSIIQFLVPTFKQDTFVHDTHWLSAMLRYQDTHTVNQTFKDNLREAVDLFHPKEIEIFGRVKNFKYPTDHHHPDPEGLLLWTSECKKYI